MRYRHIGLFVSVVLAVVACTQPATQPAPPTSLAPTQNPGTVGAPGATATHSETKAPTPTSPNAPISGLITTPNVAPGGDPSAGRTPSITIAPDNAFTSTLGLGDLRLNTELAFPNISFPRMTVMTQPADGTNRLFLALQPGRIMVFPNQESADSPRVFLDIRDLVSDRGNEEGLLGLAFDPMFAVSGAFYVYYTASEPRRSVISRFLVDRTDPNRADPTTEQVILEVPQPFPNHNGGNLLFGPDGYMYVGLGDGGAGGDPQGNGQNPSTLLGSILRIQPNGADAEGGYTVPEDNPFVGISGFRDEIWAYGLRNPWRFSFDRETGQLWVGDVGQNAFEEIDLVTPGRNYGWNIWEGFHCFSETNCVDTDMEPPVVEYPLSGGNCAVVGGYVYRGSQLPSLQGAYIYGDFCSGRIWALRHDGRGITDSALILNSGLQISSFAEGQAGELYVLSFDGRIHRLR